jgi:hypothetical protein
MPQNTLPTIEALRQVALESIDPMGQDALCDAISAQLARRAFAEEDPLRPAATLIAFIAGLRLNPEHRDVLTVGRYAADDGLAVLNEDQLALLAAWLSEIGNIDLRARAADFLWLRRKPKNHLDGRSAVTAYITSAQNILTNSTSGCPNWPAAHDRLRRALDLSHIFKDSDPVVAAIEATIPHQSMEGPQRARFMSLLVGEKIDETRYEALATAHANERTERAIQEAHGNLGFHFAREYWELARRWRMRIHGVDSIEAKRASHESAMTYVLESERAQRAGELAVAAHHLIAAIEHLRDCGEGEAVLESHLKRSTELMRRAPRGRFSHSIDVTDSVREGATSVKGLSLLDALRRMASDIRPMQKADATTYVEELNNEFIAAKLMPSVHIADDGRQLGCLSYYNESPEDDDATKEQERVLNHQLWEHARLVRLFVAARVHGALQQLLAEHSPRLADLAPLVNDSHLVPSGHKQLFAQGLLHGLTGDLAAAVHILIPQLENGLRYFAQTHLGRTLISQRPGAVQHVGLLQRILALPELRSCLGEDLAFELEGFFVAPLGTNFRNVIAHGLVGDPVLGSYDALYCWGLCLKLCIGLIPRLEQPEDNDHGGE